jgi:serine/threonine-protein kinase
MVQSLHPLLLSVGLAGTLMSCQTAEPLATNVSTRDGSEAFAAPSDDEPLAADFQTVVGDGVSLALPVGYEGGNPERDLETVAQQLDQAGAEHHSLSEALRERKQAIALIAFDEANGKSGFVTNVNVTRQRLEEETSLEIFLAAVVTKIETLGYRVAESGMTEFQGEAAGRLVVEMTAGNQDITQLVYAIPTTEAVWLITYSTPQDEFAARRAQFEASAATFTIIPAGAMGGLR